jgi:hypothetical protein
MFRHKFYKYVALETKCSYSSNCYEQTTLISRKLCFQLTSTRRMILHTMKFDEKFLVLVCWYFWLRLRKKTTILQFGKNEVFN